MKADVTPHGLRARSYLGFFPGHKVIAEGLHGELHGVPQLVAEVAVAEDTVDVQVDVPACRGEDRTGERKRESSVIHSAAGNINNNN